MLPCVSSCSSLLYLTLNTTGFLNQKQIGALPMPPPILSNIYICLQRPKLAIFVPSFSLVMADLPAVEHHSPLSQSIPNPLPTSNVVHHPPLSDTDVDDDNISSTWIDHLIDDLKRSNFGFYTATPNLASMAQFFLGGGSGDIAIVKNNRDNEVVELLLSGIFEIDRELFFMNADGGFPSSNMFNRKFIDTKLTCLLIPVQNNEDAFSSARNDYNAIISNIKALEKLIPLKKGESVQSCLRESGGKPCIQISHSLFVVCLLFSLLLFQFILMYRFLQKNDDDADAESAAQDGKKCTHSFLICLLTFFPLERLTAQWPVHERAKAALASAALTHNISPLLAYDEDHTPIPPKNYQRKLCGAIVQVHFALVHYFIKQSKKSVFTAVTREIVVLRAPLNPLKRGCFTGEPSIASSKRECFVSIMTSLAF